MNITKKMTAIFIAITLCFMFSGQALAQEWYGAITYQIAFPMGDTKDFAGNTSFRGVGLDFRKVISHNTTAGLRFGWNVFNERTDKTIELQGETPGAVTGVQDRYVNSFPMMLNVHKYFGERGGAIKPYVGVNAGGYIMLQRFEIGIFAFQRDQWQWGGAPEIGLVIPLGASEGTLFINGRYDYAFTGKLPGDIDVNQSYFSINIGFAWENY